MLQAPRRSAGRAGFTLIELLIVIAIIGVLASLAGVAVFRLIGTQQSSNTRASLTRFEGEFKKQWEAQFNQVNKESLPPPGPSNDLDVYNKVVLPMANGDTDVAKVLWVSFRMKQNFPQTFNEALNPYPFPAKTTYAATLTQAGYTAANTNAAAPQNFESSACLLLALQRGVNGVGVKLEDLGVNSSIHDFGPTPNGQTVKGLVDAWGNPIAYCRWPAYSTQAGNGTGSPPPGVAGFNDPLDPQGQLAKPAWLGSQGAATFQSLQVGHPLAARQASGPFTYRLYPAIASAGRDGVLGLDPLTFAPLAATPQGGPADDLYATLAP